MVNKIPKRSEVCLALSLSLSRIKGVNCDKRNNKNRHLI